MERHWEYDIIQNQPSSEKQGKRKLVQLSAHHLNLNEISKPLANQVGSLVNELSDVKEEIKQLFSSLKSEDTSMYIPVEDIIKKCKIFWSAYHSSQINDVGIKLLVYSAESIMEDIKELMVENLL